MSRQDTHRVIDTNVVSYFLSGKPEGETFKPILEGYIGVLSFVTVGEMLFGAIKNGWGEARTAKLEAYIRDNYLVAGYDLEIAQHWAALVSDCAREGVSVRDNDAWIAATALGLGCPVVTNDAAFKSMEKCHSELVVLP